MYTIGNFLSDIFKLPLTQEVKDEVSKELYRSGNSVEEEPRYGDEDCEITDWPEWDDKNQEYEYGTYKYSQLKFYSNHDLGDITQAWEQTHVRHLVLNGLGYPDGVHPILSKRGWCPLVKSTLSKGLLELLKVEGNYARYEWLYRGLELGWSIDQLRKVALECVDTPHRPRRRMTTNLPEFINWIGLEKFIKLLEVKTKTLTFQGEERTVSTTHLLNDCIKNYGWLVEEGHEESLKQKPRLRDLFEVHDWLFKTKVKLEPSYALREYPEVQEIVGDSWEGFDVVFPTESDQLKLWGHKLSHCVGGYGQAVNAGQSCIFSLDKDGEPIYTIELNPLGRKWKVNQFFGYGNSHAPEELDNKLRSLFPDNLFSFSLGIEEIDCKIVLNERNFDGSHSIDLLIDGSPDYIYDIPDYLRFQIVRKAIRVWQNQVVPSLIKNEKPVVYYWTSHISSKRQKRVADFLISLGFTKDQDIEELLVYNLV